MERVAVQLDARRADVAAREGRRRSSRATAESATKRVSLPEAECARTALTRNQRAVAARARDRHAHARDRLSRRDGAARAPLVDVISSRRYGSGAAPRPRALDASPPAASGWGSFVRASRPPRLAPRRLARRAARAGVRPPIAPTARARLAAGTPAPPPRAAAASELLPRPQRSRDERHRTRRVLAGGGTIRRRRHRAWSRGHCLGALRERTATRWSAPVRACVAERAAGSHGRPPARASASTIGLRRVATSMGAVPPGARDRVADACSDDASRAAAAARRDAARRAAAQHDRVDRARRRSRPPRSPPAAPPRARGHPAAAAEGSFSSPGTGGRPAQRPHGSAF